MSIPVESSNMHEYMGRAAADKEQDSRELLVYPSEFLPFTSGELKAVEVDNEVDNKGSKGYQGTVKTTNILKCIYRDNLSNRAFPPDIRKGEEVIIFNYGDDNTWYWRSSGRNDNARRTETYRIEISGSLDYVGKNDDDNTYFFEMDTRRSHRIRISTSKQDEEKYRYLFAFDVDRNSIFLGDDAGNQFFVDSEQPRVCMKNKSNSLVDLNDKNIVIMAEKDISIVSTKGNLTFSAQQGTSTHYSKQRMYQYTDAVMDLQSKDNMNLKTDNSYTRTVKVDSTTTITGNQTTSIQGNSDYSIQGNFSLAAQGTGNCSITGNMTIQTQGTGGISSTGNMTLSTQATATISSASTMNLSAGGGLSMSFNGSGMCDSHGGQMTMKLSKLSITS